jgi:di/tricarboxylate transporter
METMSLWEKLLIGIVVVLVLLWFRPGLKAAFKERRPASQAEWLSALIPIALVAAFVALLIMLT